jgi:phosphate-selective porin OprO/OprP
MITRYLSPRSRYRKSLLGFAVFGFALLAGAPTSGVAQDETTDTDNDLRAFWKDTLRIETPDKDIRLKFGGRFQWDLAAFYEHDGIDEFGDFKDDTLVRRARVYASGSFLKTIEFKAQFDLADETLEAKDLYGGLINLPAIGNIRAGHFKEPFGLNELTSSKYAMFMERSLTTETFSPGRNEGVMIFNTALDERMTWSVGYFRDTGEYLKGEIEDARHITGRLTGLPWYKDDGSKLLHLGIAWSYQDLNGDDAGFDAVPESDLAPDVADTGDIAADSVNLLGLEAALVYDSFSLQGEYIRAFVDRDSLSDLEFDSFYIQASYILTGEHRNYETDVAEFGRIRPNNNFADNSGLGAWEVALRLSYLDLDDDDISGGRVTNISAGPNWYLNSNMRVTWNYVHSDVEGSGDVDIFQMRIQIAF